MVCAEVVGLSPGSAMKLEYMGISRAIRKHIGSFQALRYRQDLFRAARIGDFGHAEAIGRWARGDSTR